MSDWYWCNNCKRAVMDLDVVDHPVYEDGFYNPYESSSTCPYCGEEIYEEAGVCAICGENIDPEEKLCPECKEDLFTIFEAKVDGISLDLDIDKSLVIELMDEWLAKRGNI